MLAAHALQPLPPPAPPAFQREYVSPRRPLVLRGLVNDWPAMRSWSFPHLERALAGTLVTAAAVEKGNVVMDPKRGLLHERIDAGAFIAALRAGARDRYVMAPLPELPPDVARDIAPPGYCDRAPFQLCTVWIGAPGTVSALHRDLADNIHAQVLGRKRFTLVAPRFTGAVYANGLLDSVPNGCRVDIERPDYARFPRLRGACTFVAELNPGDAIYIPRWWWHHVRTLEPSVSVNYWWANGLHAAGVIAADWFKRARGISR